MAEVDDFLAHYGVKGMKWGVRRNSDTGVRPIAKTLDESKFGRAANANAKRYMAKQAAKTNAAAPKRLSRKEHKAKVKRERDEFYQKKANKLLDEVMNDPEVLVNVRTMNGTMVASGKEFLDFMRRGGVMDVRATDIYARKTADGKNYELNADMNKQYKAPKR